MLVLKNIEKIAKAMYTWIEINEKLKEKKAVVKAVEAEMICKNNNGLF